MFEDFEGLSDAEWRRRVAQRQKQGCSFLFWTIAWVAGLIALVYAFVNMMGV